MLRRIFKHLQAKWYRYLLEIIVVIVGILIAYNVEQWGDTRNTRKKEIEMLKEFKRGLSSDLGDMHFNMDLHINSIRSSEMILRVIREDLPYHDSLDACFAYTHAFTVFSGRMGPIEQLKNANLAIISNDSLRLQIIAMYDEAYPRIRLVELAIRRDYEQLRDFDRLYFDAYDFDRPSTSKSIPAPPWGVMRPLQFNELKRNPEYAALLRARISNQRGLLHVHYFGIEKSLTNLLAQIDKEIARLE